MGSASAYDADASSSSAGTGTDSTMTKQPKAPKHDLTSLNAELAARGWTKRPLRLSGMSERETSEVVGVIYEIVSSAQSNVENLDALAARYRTLEYEQDRTAKALSMSRAAQRKAEGDAAGWKMRMADLERRLALEEGKTRELREDVGRARKAVENVRIAAAQDQKKTQARYEAAQAKLARYAADSALLSGAQGMTVLNPIAPGRSTPVAFGQAALLEQSLRDLTEIREAVQQENEDFRHVVVSAGNALRETLAMTQGEKESPRLHHSQFFTLTPQLRSSPFAASLSPSSTPTFPEIADVRLKSLISSLSTVLSSRIIRVPTASASAGALTPEEVEAQARAERDEQKRTQDLLDRMKDLEVEVQCAKQREMEAKKTMEEMTNRQVVQSMAKAGEREKDAEELLGILKERERLEGERRGVREMMERYEREKKVFEVERRAFLDERRRVDVDSILAQLPGTPSQSSSSSTKTITGAPLAIATASEPSTSSSTSNAASSPSASSEGGLADASSSASSSTAPAHSPKRARPALQTQTSWHAHQPSSPSPLSPHRPRTPKAKAHVAGIGSKGKRARTPLSRLVLEKAARKGGAGADQAVGGSSTAAAAGGVARSGMKASTGMGGVKALGEGGRMANTAVGVAGASIQARDKVDNGLDKGKGRAVVSFSAGVGSQNAGGGVQAEKKRASPVPMPSTAGRGRLLTSSGAGKGVVSKTAGGLAASASGAAQGAAVSRSKPVWR